MWDSFTTSVGLRHLRFGFAQTLLAMGVVVISVTLIIYLSSLIGGLQKRLITTVTGAIPQIVISPPEREPVPPGQVGPFSKSGKLYIGRIPTLEQRKRKIEDWRRWLPVLERFDPQITAVSPVVEGDGILSRGEKRYAVAITGVIPARANKVVEIQSRLVKGRFLSLRPNEVALGYRIIDELNLRIGDKVRLTSSEGVSGSYTIAGIFDTGFQAVDSRTAFIILRDAESLFGLERAVTSIDLRLRDVFQADEISRRLRLQVPYDVDSWMTENQALLSALRTQTMSSMLILAFTTIAAGFGIASILITSITSKLREIGILKAMGATRNQILGIFTFESTLLATIGGIVGAGVGIAISLLTYRLRVSMSPTGRREEVFPIDLRLETVLGAVAVAIAVGFLASLYPSWRASKVNPIEVIRGQ
ncbi:MAG: ABC transporter permease [Armatimonadota bacterium]